LLELTILSFSGDKVLFHFQPSLVSDNCQPIKKNIGEVYAARAS